MRQIIALQFYTVDGLMSDMEDTMEWVTADFNPEMGAHVDKVYKASDTLFLGATTYQIMAGYWPTAADNPDAMEGDAEFAATMNNLKKIVFSGTPLTPEWANTEFRPTIDADEIKAMKAQPGQNMLIQGAASVVSQFANPGLIDEYHLLVPPIILAQGKPLFTGIKASQPLKLLESKAYDNGVVLLRYAPKES